MLDFKTSEFENIEIGLFKSSKLMHNAVKTICAMKRYIEMNLTRFLISGK